MAGVPRKQRNRLAARFSRPEIRRMEMLLQQGNDELSDPNFHQKLADEFNAQGRTEKKAIQMQQIQRWFLSRLKIEKIVDISSSNSSIEMDSAGDESLPNNALQCFDLREDNCDDISEGFEMDFEAKSYRDQAWYDVSTFLAHRVLSSGEILILEGVLIFCCILVTASVSFYYLYFHVLEVRVRFAGFGPEEDEWVNVATAVRDRSIPMEASECWRVNEGDILLCFREKDETAYHFDAHVVSIERISHDIRGCSCTFSVQYVHDQVEETVHLSQLCRRP